MLINVEHILTELKALANEKVFAHNKKDGAGDNQFGVKLGDIRKLAEKYKANTDLAGSLWETGKLEAQLVAILWIKPKNLSADDLDAMVRSVQFVQVSDWLVAYTVKFHPNKEELRQKWMTDTNQWAARAGWSLSYDRLNKDAEGLDISALLDRIEAEMPQAAAVVQWTMNFCLAAIGINFAEHRERAVAIGERLGLYRDYPVSKGCTSPFAPIWIDEMVKRQG